MKVADNVLQTIGNTPMVRLQRLGAHTKAEIYGKMEYLNPGGSVKDRIAFQIIADAEAAGEIRPGGTIVEATSGNTGAGLALAAAVRGYRCIFVMPDKMSEEKIRALRAYGAKVVITPTNVEPEDPRSYYSVARRLATETPNAFYANQYHNQSNPRGHYLTTGPEIWTQMEGRIDAFVSAAGTGGTISGTGKYLKEQDPEVKIIAADPIGSVYYDYFYTGKMPPAYAYKVEGFGEDFLPSTMHFEFVDEVIRVTDRECFDACRRLVREEGLYTGGSAGGAVAAAIKYAERLDRPARIVTILCDSASRYLSKIFDDEWMRENGFLGEDTWQATVGELLGRRRAGALYSTTPKATVLSVIEQLRTQGISQVPVLDQSRVVGIVGERDLLAFLVQGGDPSRAVEDIMKSDFAVVEPGNRVGMLSHFFTRDLTVLVMDEGKLAGIITKIDWIDFVSHRQ
jgi:cystathionine beta-synthase